MKLHPIRTAMFAVVAIFSASLFSPSVQAQIEQVRATLITSGTLTTDDVSDMDFGEFFILITGADTPTLTMEDNGAVAVAVGAIGTSTVTPITAPTTRGAITVTVPSALMALTMTRSGTIDFADPGLTLTSVEYATATEGNGNALNADAAFGTVTAVGANVAETISFGAVITVGPQPALGTHTASFNVTLSF